MNFILKLIANQGLKRIESAVPECLSGFGFGCSMFLYYGISSLTPVPEIAFLRIIVHKTIIIIITVLVLAFVI